MNNLSMRKLFLFVFILSLTIGSCNAKLFKKNASRSAERGLFGKSLGNKEDVKIKEPSTVNKAKKKQGVKESNLKKDKAQSVERSQKRTIDIQTTEVQVRMKQNQKDSALRDKEKKKKVKASTKKAGKKYR